MRVTVEFSWTELGVLTFEEGRLRFPTAPDVPSIYRFDLGNRVYVGETDRLRRRLQHYRTPGPSQATNLRLNKLMTELLGAGEILVSIITEATIELDCERNALDLADKKAQVLVENAALRATK